MPYDPARHHRRSIRLQGYDYTWAGAYFVTLVTYQRICWIGKMERDAIRLTQAGLVAEGELQRLENRFPGVLVNDYVIMPNHIHAIIVLPGTLAFEAGVSGAVDKSGDPGISGISGISGVVGARQEKDSKIENHSLASPLPESLPPLQGSPPSPLRDSSTSQRDSPTPPNSPMPPGPRSGELGTIVGAFKSTTARLINGINHTPGAPLWLRNYYERIIRSDDDLERTHLYIQNNPRRWSEDEDNLWR